MKQRKELFKTPEYWLENIQNEIFRNVYSYMENADLNKAGLAKKLGFSRSYITQVLNGNFNFSLKKMIELSLAIGKVPKIEFENVESYVFDKEQRLDRLEKGMQVSYNYNDLENSNLDFRKYAA